MRETRVPSHPHTIRFPDDIYFKIRLLSQQHNRTFNGQVIHLIELGYGLSVKVKMAQDEVTKKFIEELIEEEGSD